MKIVIQLIQNYLKQEVPSIIITTDNNRYLFNVPSSFQRFTRQHRTKFPVGARVFFTKTSTTSITGLTGLLLTLFHIGSSSGMKMYIDDKMFKYMEELRYKMGFKAGPLSYTTWNGQFRKGILDQKLIQKLSTAQNFGQVFDNLHQYIDKELPIAQQNNACDYFNKQTLIFKDEDLEILPFFINEQGQQITNFIIIPGKLPGKILTDKLKQFGIKGKNITKLTQEGSIQIGGRRIRVEEVRQPSTSSPNVIILHYRYKETILDILKNQRLNTFVLNKNNFIYQVIHIVQSAETVVTAQFKELLSMFPKETEHLVYNGKFRTSPQKLQDLVRISSQVKLVSELHKYFPLCMPNLHQKNYAYVKEYIGKTQAIDLMFPQFKIRTYKRCHELVLAPKKSWGYRLIGAADKKQQPMEIEVQVPQVEIQLEEELQAKFKEINPKVIFLGTGSMKPSKYRNVSSIIVQWNKGNSIMFDCGQGSHVQLIDHYGFQQYQQILLSLRTIFITHIHSDHNLGLLDLISERTKLLKNRGINLQENKLFLILPANVVPWYNSFCKYVQDLNEGCSVIFIQALRNQDFSFSGTMSKQASLNRNCSVKSEMVSQDEENGGDAQQEDQLSFVRPEWDQVLKKYFEEQQFTLKHFLAYLESIGIQSFFPCPVIHCPQSYGICITHKSGVKVSYSGDTRPCEQFAKAAENSTILIHQATFGDDLQHNALSHYHSTVGQAIDIAMEAKSWKLALTHFSQRYKSAEDIVDPRNYNRNKQKKIFAKNHTIVCFDHLEIDMSKAHLMPEYSRAIASAIPKDNKE